MKEARLRPRLTMIGAFLIAVMYGATAWAEEPREHVGVIKDNLTLRPVAAAGNFSVNGASFPARDKTICMSVGNSVARVLLESPMVQPTRGFDLNIGMSVGGDDIDEYERPGCSLIAIVIGYNRDEQGRVVSDGEGPATHLRINQPSMILESFFLTGDAKDDQDENGVALKSPQRFFTEPKATESTGGYPTYSRWTVISRHGAPPLVVPATRAQYLGWQRDWLNRSIATDEQERRKLQAFAVATKTLDQSGEVGKLIASLQSELGKVNATLAALSAAERSAPAWYSKNPDPQASMAMRYVDARANTSGAQPLFGANPNYLDRTKDNQAQIILIDLANSSYQETSGNGKAVDSNALLKQLEESWIPLLPKLEDFANR